MENLKKWALLLLLRKMNRLRKYIRLIKIKICLWILGKNHRQKPENDNDINHHLNDER